MIQGPHYRNFSKSEILSYLSLGWHLGFGITEMLNSIYEKNLIL